MSYIALYRKWRPLAFQDVVEQEHVVKTLKNSVNTNRVGHAYLFCGTRGTGKTTMAKIFSRAINCLDSKEGDPCNQCEICKGILSGNILDVVEIDAASNNSVDNVREIRDEVVYMPSQSKYKVYIIDEVHMLSSGAFNALLKTLEEPPAHVVFILATTEPHKLPATILSRCQRFDFRRITIESIMDRLEEIAEASGVTIQKEASRLIARMADGALRDAISILDQCMSLGHVEITYNDVLVVVGIVNDTFIGGVVDAICSRDINSILGFVDKLVMDGKDITQFVSDLVLYYRNLLICSVTPKPGDIIEAPAEALERMKQQASSLSQDEIMYVVKELSLLESGLKWATHPRILLEVSLIKVSEGGLSEGNNDIMGRLAALERKLNDAQFTMVPVGAVPATTVVSEVEVKEKKPKKPVVPAQPGKPLECWKDVLNELKSSGRMMLFSFLFEAKAVELDERQIGIMFDQGGSSKRVVVSKAENLEVLQSIIGKRLGREVRVKCIDDDSASDGEKDEENDGIVEDIRNLANEFGAEFNIIDE